MIVEPVHLLPEKALAQPQGTKDFWGDSQFLPQLPDNRFFSGFPQLHPPTRQIEIGRPFVLHGKNLPTVNHHTADPVVKLLLIALKGNVHGEISFWYHMSG